MVATSILFPFFIFKENLGHKIDIQNSLGERNLIQKQNYINGLWSKLPTLVC